MRMWLFGSAARGELRPDSDVDVLVEFEPGIVDRFDDEVALIHGLRPAFEGRWVDVKDLAKMRPEVMRTVDWDKRLLYEHGQGAKPMAKRKKDDATTQAQRDERDHIRLCHMLRAAEKMEQLADGVSEEAFLNSIEKRIAWMHLLQIIGEAAYKTSEETLAQIDGPPWNKVVIFRHVLVHDYYKINRDVPYRVATQEMRPLIDAVRAFLGRRAVDCDAIATPWEP